MSSFNYSRCAVLSVWSLLIFLKGFHLPELSAPDFVRQSLNCLDPENLFDLPIFQKLLQTSNLQPKSLFSQICYLSNMLKVAIQGLLYHVISVYKVATKTPISTPSAIASVSLAKVLCTVLRAPGQMRKVSIFINKQ